MTFLNGNNLLFHSMEEKKITDKNDQKKHFVINHRLTF